MAGNTALVPLWRYAQVWGQYVQVWRNSCMHYLFTNYWEERYQTTQGNPCIASKLYWIYLITHTSMYRSNSFIQNATLGDLFVTFIQTVSVMSWPSLIRTTSLNECGVNQIKMDEVHKMKTQIRGVKGRTELVISIPLRKHNLRMTTILFRETWTWRNMNKQMLSTRNLTPKDAICWDQSTSTNLKTMSHQILLESKPEMTKSNAHKYGWPSWPIQSQMTKSNDKCHLGQI